jgi:hypothetical protein
MLGTMRFVAGVVLAAAMGLSLASAQKAPATLQLVQIEPAKYDVEVVVVDPSGAVISHANVSLTEPSDKGELKSDVTDSAGRAHFQSQLAGKYTMQVSARGFQAAKKSLDVPSQGEVKVALSPGPPEIICRIPSDLRTETITSTLGNQLPLPPIPTPAAAPELAIAPRRNPVARFFSGIGHKLGF